jgi:diaminohydroxyphosphoribosylaminopyrimidine deaminase/5-amino-6-(5-phosphoribosylamino)uracil reductase
MIEPDGGGVPASAFTAEDHRWMAHAVVLARRGIGLTDPNPSVGCVLVRGGESVGEGTTAEAGGPHAEIVALAAAGQRAAGATAYVTLEPCAHFGRTGPCTRALIAAGVARVVAASLDPDARMNGQGLAELEAAGIATAQGCQAASARDVNPGYWSRFERGRPWVRLKLAASLDGRTALANGQSQWITGAEARADVHRWRARSSAVMTGSGTVLADDPALTARPASAPPFVQPLRIVVDSSLRTPPAAKLLAAGGPVLIFHAAGAGGEAAALRDRGAGLEAIDGGPRVDLPAMLSRLAALAVNTVWVEAGARLSGALLEAHLVDQLVVYLAPDLLGDSARGMAGFGPLGSLADRLRFRFDDVRRIGADLRIIATPGSVPDR